MPPIAGCHCGLFHGISLAVKSATFVGMFALSRARRACRFSIVVPPPLVPELFRRSRREEVVELVDAFSTAFVEPPRRRPPRRPLPSPVAVLVLVVIGLNAN